MKKMSIFIVAILGVFFFTACQSTVKTPTAKEFAIEFIQEFLTLSYDEAKPTEQVYDEVIEKLKPYFTEEGFNGFTNNMLFAIPIKVVERNQANMTVKNVELEETFNEEDGKKIGFYITVDVEVPNGVASQPISLSIQKDNNEWKIYSLAIQKVVDLLQN